MQVVMPRGEVVGNGWEVGEDDDFWVAVSDLSECSRVVFLDLGWEDKKIILCQGVVC